MEENNINLGFIGFNALLILSSVIILGSLIMAFKKGGKKALVGVLILLASIYLFIVCNMQMYGNGMEPTLRNDEQVVLFKLQYYLNEPQRGEIVIYKYPKNEDADYIGRIIAIGGDTVQIKEGLVYLNGSILVEPYVMGVTIPSSEEGAIKEGETLKIPADSIFVMADNRQHSVDGRIFGPIHKSKLIGIVPFRLWPPDKFGLITVKTPAQNALTGEDLYNVGEYFLSIKNTTKAEEYFMQASNNYKYVPAMIALGDIYLVAKDYERSTKEYLLAAELGSDNPFILHNIAGYYSTIGNKENAIKYANEALAAYEKGDLTKENVKSRYDVLRKFILENTPLK